MIPLALLPPDPTRNVRVALAPLTEVLKIFIVSSSTFQAPLAPRHAFTGCRDFDRLDGPPAGLLALLSRLRSPAAPLNWRDVGVEVLAPPYGRRALPRVHRPDALDF